MILGLGRYGGAIYKTLAWCGQMPGYELQIHGYDTSLEAVSKFRASCPALFQQYPNMTTQALTFGGEEFVAAFSNFDAPTLVICCLGDDQRNAEAEQTVKMLCARNGWDTDILILGNRTEMYRYAALTDNSGYAIHQAWVETQGENPVVAQELYNKNEYNYWSTRASAIWQKHRRRLGIADDAPETEVAEHERWMAYMLSQGFVYGSVKDLFMAKTHPSITDFNNLSDAEKAKDGLMARAGT